MKNLFVLILFVLSSIPVFSQEEEIIFTGDINHGGYGSPEIKFLKFYGQSGILSGGKGGWIINHQLVIGAAGYRLTSSIYEYGPNVNPIYSNLSKYDLSMGYGGIFLEYIFLPNKLIHANIQTIFAWGRAEWKSDDNKFDRNFDFMYDQDDFNNYYSDDFFIIEPQINVELNATSWMKINAGVSYRIVNGLDLKTPVGNSIKNSDLGGISGSVSFKFGLF